VECAAKARPCERRQNDLGLLFCCFIISGFKKVHLAVGYTNMRKSLDAPLAS
jgi:hypothetical protein